MLNARYHEQEAHIIAQAGRPGAVTIATNMAGRGTDIQLGGNLDIRLKAELALRSRTRPSASAAPPRSAPRSKPARDVVREAGGLFVLGTERHESRRIDNQLRGRSGRQGDPGASKFFLSLDDDLMRIFGSERMEFDAVSGSASRTARRSSTPGSTRRSRRRRRRSRRATTTSASSSSNSTT